VLFPFENDEGGSANRDSYVLALGRSWMSTNISLEEIQGLRDGFSGDFLWFRRGAKAYLVRDPAILTQARALFDSLRSLEPGRKALERRQQDMEKKQEPLERELEELDRLADRLEDGAEGRRPEAALRDLEDRRRDLESRLREIEVGERGLEAEERSFDQKEEALEKKAEERLWRLIDRDLRRRLARPADLSELELPHRLEGVAERLAAREERFPGVGSS
jgi:chromosome segregation ATPase